MPRSLLLYGKSGIGKTSQCRHIARWIYERTGKVTRLVSADGGGFAPVLDSGLVEAKIVYPFPMPLVSNQVPLAFIRRVSEGKWPRQNTRDGKWYFTQDSAFDTKPEEWDRIGCIFVESLGAICRLFAGHMGQSSEKQGFERPKFVQEEYTFGGIDKGHVGMIQGTLNNLVNAFSNLPVDLVVFTSLIGLGEVRGSDSTESVYGPEAIGKAITASVPSWVGDCIHLDHIQADREEPGGIVRRYTQLVGWFMPHTGAQNATEYLAKCRLPPEDFPKLLQKYPKGYVPIGFTRGIDLYLEEIDSISKSSLQATLEWKKQADSRRD